MYLKLDESKWYRHTHEWSDRSKGLGRVDVYKGQIEVAEDVAPVIHAHWIHDFIDADWNCGVEIHCGWICSHCSGYAEMESKTPYCPFCGAKMEEVKKDET